MKTGIRRQGRECGGWVKIVGAEIKVPVRPGKYRDYFHFTRSRLLDIHPAMEFPMTILLVACASSRTLCAYSTCMIPSGSDLLAAGYTLNSGLTKFIAAHGHKSAI